ncbi:sulfate ABC transporter permease subunit CysT [Labrys monachus]|nr:sulfate ABC transporter permease subunit CysT [Labrys monachus]
MTSASTGRWRDAFVKPSALPGFGLTMGYTILYLSLLVLIPLAALILKAGTLGLSGIVAVGVDPRVTAALRVTFGISFLAAIVNVVFGTVVAWVLARYDFTGKRLVDAAVDLPFALPTAVAGLALSSLYAPNGWLGQFFAPFGIKIAYSPIGIFIALVFIGLPFVVRTLQPVLGELDSEIEEASATLGASRLQTVTRVVLPPLVPAILTGFALAFARAIGEYGSVIFISDNLPYRSEIVPSLIVQELEQNKYAQATAIAIIMLAISFVMLLVINLIQAWSRKRMGHV